MTKIQCKIGPAYFTWRRLICHMWGFHTVMVWVVQR